MDNEYYIVEYVFSGRHNFFLWYTANDQSREPDGIVLNEDRQIVVFESKREISEYAKIRKLSELSDNDTNFDFDLLQNWLDRPSLDQIDCVSILDYWNIFSDLERSLSGKQEHIDDKGEGEIYDKLFWGCNLPSVTPPGERYIPNWSDDEIQRLASILNCGLTLFRRAIPSYIDN